ncbi:restriction endonuclease [Agrococcus sediminis]|uniref:Restriction endonuclease n=1 Tax=Agrococcus sediminis TaxID=2599924 RepID=A0A5M8QJU3_9MICO|nr:restriction endonuclease [Agrococcus sediminis]KAA6434923.1 restriction endonuclease [Agrococcus sediminis]
MRFDEWITLVDDGYSTSAEFEVVQDHILDGIDAIRWPHGSDDFAINPTRKGNGVKPIKDAFITRLLQYGWEDEFDYFDAHYTFPRGDSLPFVVEWETGNISSSHRAINRMAKGMLEGRIAGGLLVLPTAALYPYLTDRIGNLRELRPYLELWSRWQGQPGFGYLGIASVEHDRLDHTVPTIAKGTDGRALL